jgi:DNA-binding transcriptional MerR regulator
LRFWETQFPSLRPRHSRSKHRLYTAQDIESFKLIKRLLYQERFTIEGARKHLKQFGFGQAATAAIAARESQRAAPRAAADLGPALDASTRQALTEIRRELEGLHRLLKE